MGTNTAQTPATHKRINETLTSYWEALRGDRAYPSEGDIDPSVIDDIWNACFLVKLSSIDDTGHYRYTYLGTYLIDAYGDDMTDQEVSSLVDPDSQPMIVKFAEVAKSGKPMNVESEFTNKHGVIIKYRSCLLPLGEPGKGVDYILGGMKWKLA